MDCDDNDFHIQNFQLVAEDSSKFPSGLRSFPLPKLDLDDHSEAHLRFASVVETESLLGIPVQENNWIDNSSLITSSLDFTPIVAECPYIFRNKNVWSEATLSESVEMLLKSVCEDDLMNDRVSGIKVDDSSNLKNQVNSCSEQNIFNSDIEDIVRVDISRPLDICEKSFSTVITDSTGMQHHLNSMSQPSAGAYIEISSISGILNSNQETISEQFTKDEVALSSDVAKNLRHNVTLNNDDDPNSLLGKSHVNSDANVPVSEIDSMSMSMDNLSQHTEVRESVFPKKSDGLLEDIAYPAKFWKKDDTAADDKVIASENLSVAEDVIVVHEKEPVIIDSSLNSDIIEHFEVSDSDQLDPISRKVCHDESSVFLQNVDCVVGHAHDIKIDDVGEIDEKPQDKSHKIQGIKNSLGKTPVETVTEHSATGSMNQNVEAEAKNGDASSIDPLNSFTLNSGLSVVKNYSKVPLEISIGEPEVDALDEHPISQSITGLEAVRSAQITGLVHFPTEKMTQDEAGKVDTEPPPLLSEKSLAIFMMDTSEKEILDEMCTSGYSIHYSARAPSLTTIDSKPAGSPSAETDLLNLEGASLSQKNVTHMSEKDIFTQYPAEGDTIAEMPELTTLCDYGEYGDHVYLNPTPLPNSDVNGSFTGSVENATLDVASGAFPSIDHQDRILTEKFGVDSLNCSKLSPIQSFNMGKTDVESNLLELKHGSSCCYEPSCGSPTVIRCVDTRDEIDHDMGNSRSSAQSDCIIVRHDDDKAQSEDDVDHRTEDDMSFTFQVKSFSNISEKGHEGNLVEYSLVSDQSNLVAVSKTSVEDKSLPESAGETSKVCLSEDNQAIYLPKRDETRCTTHHNILGDIKKDADPEEDPRHLNTKKERMKSSCSPATAQVSAIPDLNSSACTPVLFHQPFTDIQQVQLRAQIFVYGSLIQGMPPDETCMLSAFGDSDGGRTVWESVWRVALDRFESQKLPHGVRTPEQVSRYNSLQSKTPSPHPEHGGPLPVPLSPLFNSVSFPLPLWSLSSNCVLPSSVPRGMHLDFSQAPSPSYSSQGPQARQHLGNAAAQWISKSSQSPFGTIVGPSQSLKFNSSVKYSAIAAASTGAPITSVRSLSGPQTSCASISTLGPASVSLAPAVLGEVKSKILTPGSSKKTPASQKVRRLSKKFAALERIGPLCSPSIPNTENSALPDAARIVTSPSNLSSFAKNPMRTILGSVIMTSNILSPTFQVASGGQADERMSIREESCIRTEQSKLQADDAAALAASAMKHSNSIWCQLSLQRDYLSTREAEQKLACAAVAAAAAVAVAKAAAAAAKVAVDAAVQAKMMADEAQNGPKLTNNLKNIEVTDTEKCSAKPCSFSILRGNDKLLGCSSSILDAAREATRRKMESSSSAAKKAENIDAIVRAAELVVEAVSQAGAIIAMGDPLPLTISELIEAGPEAYWKGFCLVSQISSEGHAQNVRQRAEINGSVSQNVPAGQLGDSYLDNNEGQRASHEEVKSSQDAFSIPTDKDNTGNTFDEKTSRSSLPLERDLSQDWHQNTIEKGAVIEVAPDEDGLKGVWYSARVLDLKDGKAFICYDYLLNEEGSSQLTEWIPLDFDGNMCPRMRIAHPIMTTKADGVGKRRRDAMIDNYWAVGDHVDAWMREGWWEGIVTEKKEDETKLTIHFPAGGDSSVVRAWNLRPSLLWKDGRWINWSRSRADSIQFHEGDTPNVKRQKSSNLVASSTLGMNGAKTEKNSRNLEIESSGIPHESRPLDFSAVDSVFYPGSLVDSSNSNKIPRTGLRKGGSGVIFGLPKPGKKRKFMDVSKHYIEDRLNKTGEGNDTIKFAKYLMPQASLLTRNSSQMNEKSRPGLDSKTKVPMPLARSQSIQSRSTADKDRLPSSYMPFNAFGAEKGRLLDPHASFFSNGRKLDRSSLESNSFLIGSGPPDHGSATELPAHDVQGFPLSLKMNSYAVEEYTREKGNLISAVDKTTRNKETGLENPRRNMMTEAVEPRRSNRKIQPTSRLLEGLQSSLITSKVPHVSHEKSSRSFHRGGLKGTTH